MMLCWAGQAVIPGTRYKLNNTNYKLNITSYLQVTSYYAQDTKAHWLTIIHVFVLSENSCDE